MSRPKKRKVHWGRVVILAAVLAAAALGFWVWNGTRAPGGGKDVELEVKQGESLESLTDSLYSHGLIQNRTIARLYLQLKKTAWYAGVYTLNQDLDLKQLSAQLSNVSNAKQGYVALTVPEGTWAKEIAASISQKFPFTQEEVLAKWNDMDYIKTLAQDYPFLNPAILSDPAIKVKLEGFLFPETYYVNEDAGIDEITRMMLDQFNDFYQQHQEQFAGSMLSTEELVTLASIVQFESGQPQDMKTIAGVFYNRLADDMKLQSSVTVCYALYDQFDDPEDCETQYDIKSPYNTYLIEGLPPGPILNPGAAALDAVLNPEQNDYLFFVADIYHVKSNPGKVYYSKTYEEHQQLMKDLHLVIE